MGRRELSPPDARRQRRLATERGSVSGHGPARVALVYPSPYAVGMSSLGYQTVYRLLSSRPGVGAERAFLPDQDEPADVGLTTYERQRPVGDFPIVAFSVSYELELHGMFRCLASAGLPVLRAERRGGMPWVVAGGPLTFSNPLPLGPFCDVVVLGEAEDVVGELCETLLDDRDRDTVLARLAERPGLWVPSVHGQALPPIAKAGLAELPARSCLVSPEATLADMFLVEPERGCSRGCTFCVMRRSTNDGMRVFDAERVLGLIPADAKRVGLVGAAVTDHPRLRTLVRSVVESGRGIGISSLRADKLDEELVGLLRRGGYRTLTVASDAPSERLRVSLDRKIEERHLLRAAELAGAAGMAQLKVYMMLGVPGETDDDVDELIAFSLRQAAALGGRTRLAIGVSPFVAKRHTPLDGQPYAGIRTVEARLARLRAGLRGRVEVRPTSARWAWVEYLVAQGDVDAGLRAYVAWQQGGTFAAWRRAFAGHPVVAAAAGTGATGREQQVHA